MGVRLTKVWLWTTTSGVTVKSVVTEISEGDVDEADLAADDNRTEFLLSEFKPDFYQLAVSPLSTLAFSLWLSTVNISF